MCQVIHFSFEWLLQLRRRRLARVTQPQEEQRQESQDEVVEVGQEMMEETNCNEAPRPDLPAGDPPSKESTSSSDEMETESSGSESTSPPNPTSGGPTDELKSDWPDLNLEPSLNKRINESPADDVKFASLHDLQSNQKQGIINPFSPDISCMDWDDSDRKESVKRQKSSITQDDTQDPIKDVIYPLICKVLAREDDIQALLEDLDTTSTSYLNEGLCIVLTSMVSDWVSKKDNTDILQTIERQKPRETWESAKVAVFAQIDNDKDFVALILFFLMQTFDVIGEASKDVMSLTELLIEARSYCIGQAIQLLTGSFSNEVSVSKRVLLPFVYSQHEPHTLFMADLVMHAFNECGIEGDFRTIFEPLLESLYFEMKTCCSFTQTQRYKRPLEALNFLCDIQSVAESTNKSRPICQLMITSKMWVPDSLTSSFAGLEISKFSFLAPFLSLSVFAEDDHKIVDNFYGGLKMSPETVRIVNQNLQAHLKTARQEMQTIVHNVIKNPGSRGQALTFIEEVLKRNSKRSQFQVLEKQVANDGFMLNMMSILQKLSEKIKVTKVDLEYPFMKLRMKMRKQESRLKMTASEAESWSSSRQFGEVNFNSECFFLALECHHISLIPCIRKYTRRIRAIREYTRVADELASQEPLYRSMPSVSQRNANVIKRWRDHVKKLTKAKTCADAGLMDHDLLTKCLEFYSLHMSIMLRAAGAYNEEDTFTAKLPLPDKPSEVFGAYPEW